MIECPSAAWERYHTEEEAKADHAAMMLQLSHSYPGYSTQLAVERGVYRHTICGAWVNFPTEGPPRVELGSIVEGVDQVTSTHTLTWPFEMDQWWKTLAAVETEAQEIWEATHGCPDCGNEDETGYIPINRKCPSCQGEGQVI